MERYEVYQKLEKIAAIYFNEATFEGERQSAYDRMESICNRYRVHLDDFLESYKRKNGKSSSKTTSNNKKTNTKTENKKEEKKKTKQYTEDNITLDDVFEFMAENLEFFSMFEKFMSKKGKDTKKDTEDKAKQYREQYTKNNNSNYNNSNYYSKSYSSNYNSSNYNSNTSNGQWRTYSAEDFYYYELRGVYIEEIGTSKNGNRYIKLNAEARLDGQERWSVQSFCIFSETLDEKTQLTKDKKFRAMTTKIAYFTRYLSIQRLQVNLFDDKYFDVQLK